jgi:hypothetical protein
MSVSRMIRHPDQEGQGRPVWLWLFGCLVLTISNCTSTEDVYLVQATDHATQTEILQYFGQPTLNHVLDTGGSVWVYRWEAGANGARDYSPVCREIHLTFDAEKVLRRWGKQRC